jgi:intergrase/recombinase
MTNEPKLEAEQVENTELTQKQREKQEREAKKYWNTMITRQQAHQIVGEAIMREQEKTQMLYVQTRTLADILIAKGIVTEEELNEISKTVIKDLFDADPTPKSDAKKKKEEGNEE